MPEGCEIKIQRDEISPLVSNKTINNITIQSGRYVRHPEDWNMNLQLPLKINSIETSGKLMIWNLEKDNFIFIRAAMSGRWTVKEEKHNHIKFDFSDSSYIYFNDTRNFGSVKFGNLNDKNLALNKLGIDVLKEDLTFDKIKDKINYKKPIGEQMLDQSIFNFCGNYLRAEILYTAKINPFKIAGELTIDEWNELCHQANEITRLSYELGGATIRSYKNLNGEKGKFVERFKVYGRKNDDNNNKIIRAIDGSKRAIWFVKEIQK